MTDFSKITACGGDCEDCEHSKVKNVATASQRMENVYTCGKVITVHVRYLVVVKIMVFHFADYVMNFPASGLKNGLIPGTKMELPTLQSCEA